MALLGRYKMTTPLTNKDAGSCQWCFAEWNGNTYFIKEFQEPKHPSTDTVSSPAKLARKQAECSAFEALKTRVYHTINSCSDGNAVRIADFFRVGGRYYMAMPRIRSRDLSVEDIAALPLKERCRLCTIIAHALASIHRGHFVHSDIKHTNILYCTTGDGCLTAKLIDFDAGFFEDQPPRHAEEVAGDQNYFSPEAWVVMSEGEAPLTRKLDIFALGVLFHQYFCGQFPEFDDEYSCAGEAVACGDSLRLCAAIPSEIREFLSRMLSDDISERPDAKEVYTFFFHLICPGQTADALLPVFLGDIPGRAGIAHVDTL